MNIDKDNREMWSFEENKTNDEFTKFMEGYFAEREQRLINNCITYANSDPAGLPGHNLIIIIEKLFAVAEYVYNSLGKDAKHRSDSFAKDQAGYRKEKRDGMDTN